MVFVLLKSNVAAVIKWQWWANYGDNDMVCLIWLGNCKQFLPNA
jgi:hypothetical protein